MKIERRFVANDLEVRKDGDSALITGYAAVFDKDSEVLGFFIERVARGAFKKTIKEADVRALQNHDPNIVLGRTKSGSLKLSEDTTGLHYEVDANLRKQSVRDLVEDIERGDVSQSSFGFSTVKDDWDYEADPLRRTLKEVRLFDVSPVTFPAYPDTETQIERALRFLVDEDRTLQDLVSACRSGELRSFLTNPVQSSEPAEGHSHRPENLHIRLAEIVVAQ